jgi:SRSO17 transposase
MSHFYLKQLYVSKQYIGNLGKTARGIGEHPGFVNS